MTFNDLKSGDTFLWATTPRVGQCIKMGSNHYTFLAIPTRQHKVLAIQQMVILIPKERKKGIR